LTFSLLFSNGARQSNKKHAKATQVDHEVLRQMMLNDWHWSWRGFCVVILDIQNPLKAFSMISMRELWHKLCIWVGCVAETVLQSS